MRAGKGKFFCLFHCYLFYKKRDKGKQLIWTTQYVIVETLTNAPQ